MAKNIFAMLGIVVGGIALILALVHFWAGSFVPQPSLQSVVAETAISIRQAAIDALRGKPVAQPVYSPQYDADKITHITTAVLGGIAFILAALSFSSHESKDAALSAAVLGISAIVFQFIGMYVAVVLMIILIIAVLSSLGFG